MSSDPMYGGSERVLEDGYTNEGSAKDDQNANPNTSDDAWWIARSRTAYNQSESWFNANVRRRVEDAMRLFNSKHPRGSKYRDETYSKRSKLFRPKTRSGMRKTEAAGAAAFFATQDAVTCSAPNPSDRMQRLGAEVNAELLNYRLTQPDNIPWFITCLGALQDAGKQGVVISKQEWLFEEKQMAFEEQEVDELTGDVLGSRNVIESQVIYDRPNIKLRPIENIRFSPAADWTDPINTSPFMIDMEPWFVGDVRSRMEEGAKGEYDVKWRDLSIPIILSSRAESFDPVRQAREDQREDRYEEVSSDVREHDVVWVHHNYFRIDGEEWYFATLGTEIMLTDPVPMSDTTPLKKRPYVMGFSVLETHKTYPSGQVDLGRPLQEEINDVTNLRIDNIHHILSPRYFVRRGQSVDIRSLMRNVPGGITAMEDPNTDVNIRQIQDATSSGYMEQDRLSVEMDELNGTFSQSSIASNQNINERVGNTQMLGESANQVTELMIRTFAETWVEPVLQQVMELEQALESDAVVLAVVGSRMGVSAEQVFRMLELPVKVSVNVGFGATNPQRRLQKVAMAFSTLGQINPQWIMEADKAEVVNEVLGAVGYKSAERFFPGIGQADQEEDPRIAQYEEQIQQLQAALEGKGQEIQAKGQIDLQREEMRLRAQDQRDQRANQLKLQIEQGKWRVAALDMQIKQEQNEFRKQELVQQRIALNHTIAMDERQYQMQQTQMEWQTGIDMPDTPYSPPEQLPSPAETKEPKPKAPEGVSSEVSPNKPRRIATTPDLGGDDKAGVIARGKYGGVPFKEG